ncbi:protein SREK1IP1-like, partial [Carassius auratus]|uniref:Protein SREK1IP1-like n=1 Tax=Carassius auratus TaxID=7957 RepID=A0A6P6PLG7_CARAU
MKPGHILKDCPDFSCRDCGEKGHFSRECDAVRCPECRKVLVKCECWIEEDVETDKDYEQVDEMEKSQDVDDVNEDKQTEQTEEEEENQIGEDAEEEQKYCEMERDKEEEGHGIQTEILKQTREEEKERQEMQMIEKATPGRKEDNKNDWEKVTITRRRQLK